MRDRLVNFTRLRDLRTSRRLSQYDLADMSGVARSTITRIELGLRSPNAKTLAKLAGALEVSMDDLLLRPHRVHENETEYQTSLATTQKAIVALKEEELADVLDYIRFLRSKRK